MDLVHQFQGVATGTVPLVDHSDDRDPTVLAYLEQLQCLRLKAFRGIDEHHRGVDGRQHAVGVFGEVGVARGVEQVDDAVRYGNCNTVDVIEMPLAFSISIQSDTVARRPALPWTAPASVMAWACSASASVNVDLPASGWLMTAKVLRRPASAEIRPGRRGVGGRRSGQGNVGHSACDGIGS